MKKPIRLLLLLLIITLIFSGCSHSTDSNQDNTVSQEEYSFEPEFETEAETEPETEAQIPEIDWTEFSYNMEDYDGYKYTVTVKLSPWILYSESEILNEAWSEVGKENLLPDLDSWGFQKSGNSYWKPYSHPHKSVVFDYGTWLAPIDDMYYCVGNLSIRNTTEGWDITSDKSVTFNTQIVCMPWSIDIDSIPVLAKAFYSNQTEMWWQGLDINANMTSNAWGPVPFVFMLPEEYTPNAPDGVRFEMLRTAYFQNLDNYPDSESIYVNIIGKNGEVFSPIIDEE